MSTVKQGITNLSELINTILKRAFSKHEDINLLQNNGYDEDCSWAYMNGYVDGLSYVLALLDPNMDYEKYIEKVLESDPVSVDDVNIGDIIFSKNAIFPNNLSIVISKGSDEENGTKSTSLFMLQIAPKSICSLLLWPESNIYKIDIDNLPIIYYKINNGNKEFAINLDNIYNITVLSNKDNFSSNYSVIRKEGKEIIDKNLVSNIIDAYKEHDRLLEKVYDKATKKE